MRLIDFPTVAKAFTLIFEDQPTGTGIMLKATVPPTWEIRFLATEMVLRRLQGRPLEEFFLDADRVKKYYGSNDALEVVALPVNDEGDRIMKAEGVTYAERKTVNEVLEAFFDGPLGPLFVRPYRKGRMPGNVHAG